MTPLRLVILLLAVPMIGINAQVNPETSENKPVRIAVNPQNPILGGPQAPPYRQMGTFISNAFVTPEDGLVLVQDSSVCSLGVPATSDFERTLHAEYSYEEEGVLSSITFSTYDEDSTRSPYSRKDYGYTDGRLTSYQYSRWADGWQSQIREMFEYNNNGKLTSTTSQSWSGGEWENASRESRGYDDRKLVDITKSNWDGASWQPTHRTTAEYNENRLATHVHFLEYNQPAWDTIARDEYIYDADLQFILTGFNHAQPGASTGLLEPVMREFYGYNLRGFFTDRVVQFWNDTLLNWQNLTRDQFTYNPLGVWKSWSRQEWHGQWTNQFFRDFRYGNGRQIDLWQTWNDEDSSWVNFQRRFVQFDQYGNLTGERSGELHSGDSNDWSNGPNAAECRHYWSEETSATRPFAASNILDCTLPNPYSANAPIQCLSLDQASSYRARLFDQTGRQVYAQTFAGSETFSLGANLPPGLYYLMVEDRKEILYRRKIAIQN